MRELRGSPVYLDRGFRFRLPSPSERVSDLNAEVTPAGIPLLLLGPILVAPIEAEALIREVDDLKEELGVSAQKDTQTLLKCYLKEDEQAMVDAHESRRAPCQRRPAGGKGGSEGPEG